MTFSYLIRLFTLKISFCLLLICFAFASERPNPSVNSDYPDLITQAKHAIQIKKQREFMDREERHETIIQLRESFDEMNECLMELSPDKVISYPSNLTSSTHELSALIDANIELFNHLKTSTEQELSKSPLIPVTPTLLPGEETTCPDSDSVSSDSCEMSSESFKSSSSFEQYTIELPVQPSMELPLEEREGSVSAEASAVSQFDVPIVVPVVQPVVLDLPVVVEEQPMVSSVIPVQVPVREEQPQPIQLPIHVVEPVLPVISPIQLISEPVKPILLKDDTNLSPRQEVPSPRPKQVDQIVQQSIVPSPSIPVSMPNPFPVISQPVKPTPVVSVPQSTPPIVVQSTPVKVEQKPQTPAPVIHPTQVPQQPIPPVRNRATSGSNHILPQPNLVHPSQMPKTPIPPVRNHKK